MLEAGKRIDVEFSNRDLAQELCVSEGTVRNYLQHVQAADLRNGYAPGEGDKDVAGLSVLQVHDYIGKPAAKHNQWLDAAKATKAPRKRRDGGKKTRPAEKEDGQVAEQVQGGDLPEALAALPTAENALATDVQHDESDHASGEEPSQKATGRSTPNRTSRSSFKAQRAPHTSCRAAKDFAALRIHLTAEQCGQVAAQLTEIRESADQMLQACAASAPAEAAAAA